MLQERMSRSKSAQESATVYNPPKSVPIPLDRPPQQMTPITTTSTTRTLSQTQQGEPEDSPPEQAIQPSAGAEAAQKKSEQPANTYARRDSGVSDEVWEQLQRDRRAEQEGEVEY